MRETAHGIEMLRAGSQKMRNLDPVLKTYTPLLQNERAITGVPAFIPAPNNFILIRCSDRE